MAKSVLITGASDGIGFEISRLALARGYDVYMLARDTTRLKAAVDSLPQTRRPRFASIDLTDESQRRNFFIGMDEAEYVPDILINNAGIGVSGPYADQSWDKLDQLFSLNMVAVAHVTHWAFQRMKARGSGSIVNMSSAVAARPSPWFAAYAASKAFISHLTRALHIEGRECGVKVSVVHPPEVRAQHRAGRQAPDLSATLSLKVLPSLAAVTVANAILNAAENGPREIAPGIVTWLAVATAGKVPAWLDIMVMSALFRHRPWLVSLKKEAHLQTIHD